MRRYGRDKVIDSKLNKTTYVKNDQRKLFEIKEINLGNNQTLRRPLPHDFSVPCLQQPSPFPIPQCYSLSIPLA